MATEITMVEVLERALALPLDERAQLAKHLLHSLDSGADEDRSSAEQVIARFRSLDARLVVAVTLQVEERSDDRDEPFGGARLA